MITLLKEMFSEMVVKKDISLIPHYYDKDLIIYTNGKQINYREFYDTHVEYYASSKKYSVVYDEQTLFASDDKVAGRMYITITRPNETPKELEVILIVQYRNNKITRVWELTFPDWSHLPAFQETLSK